MPGLPRRPGPGAAGRGAARAGLDRLCEEQGIEKPVLWYYTPMSGVFSEHLPAQRVVYDCMDELSAFKGAPPELLERGAPAVWSAPTSSSPAATASTRPSAGSTPNVHAFPSSVDVAHFRRARERSAGPARPGRRSRIRGSATMPCSTSGWTSTSWRRSPTRGPTGSFVLLGPVVKIDPGEPAAAAQHPLPGRQALRASCRPISRAGTWRSCPSR